MRQLSKDKGEMKVCIPIVKNTMKKVLEAIKEASRLAELIELRTDYLRNPELVFLLKGREKPFIITNRRKEEGGCYGSDEKRRFRILREAIDLGADYVDVEMNSERLLLRDCIAHKKRTKIVLSFHDFQKTPSLEELKNLFNRMVQMGGDVVKIVPYARSWKDNLTILSIIPYAKKRGQEIVAFCMGGRGKMSRIFAPFMGTAWTYAAPRKGKSSAPGQLTVQEMKEIWERLTR